MLIRVLGCSGAIAAGCKTTSFLLDDDVLIDAGTGVLDLSLDEMVRIDHILVSHSHLDHIVAIALLTDSTLRRRRAEDRGPVRVHALAPTLAALRAHIFNDVVWPDFTRLPDARCPAIELSAIAHGQRLMLGGRTIEVLVADHTVPACGFAVEGSDGWWVYTGDTGPNPALWQRLREMKVAHLIIETAFGDDEQALARLSRHLCPTALGTELEQLCGPCNESVNVHITHVKPGEEAIVMAEIAKLVTPHHVHSLAAGRRWALDERRAAIAPAG
jgi:ribonuclease BN (tRNA processing enzyme)